MEKKCPIHMLNCNIFKNVALYVSIRSLRTNSILPIRLRDLKPALCKIFIERRTEYIKHCCLTYKIAGKNEEVEYDSVFPFMALNKGHIIFDIEPSCRSSGILSACTSNGACFCRCKDFACDGSRVSVDEENLHEAYGVFSLLVDGYRVFEFYRNYACYLPIIGKIEQGSYFRTRDIKIPISESFFDYIMFEPLFI